MVANFEKVKELLNGEEHEKFLKDGFGEYVTGRITFTIGDNNYTMYFHEGTVVDVKEGIPLEGMDFGLKGPISGWKDLFEHRNFSKAVSPKHGKLRHQGNLIRCMGNLNATAYICRILCSIVNE